MRRLALAFALAIAVSIVMLPPSANAWTRGGHGVVDAAARTPS